MPSTPHSVDVERILDQLRARGDRITTARRAVLEEMARAGDRHLSADELTAAVNGRHPDIHLSTVYRTLEFLEQANILTHVRLGSESTYHFATEPHHHAVCDRCGRVIEVAPDVFSPVIRRLDRDYGFRASPVHLTLVGHCVDCGARDA